MNSARSALKFRLVVIVAISAFMALSSFWLSVVIKRSAPEAGASGPRTEPDYFVFNFNYVKMLPSGKPHYLLKGKKLTHNPGDDSFLVDLPIYQSLDEQNPPQMSRSDKAIMKNDNTEVHMYGNVVGDRKATASTEPLHLETEYLLVFPDEDTMQTDKPVKIKRNNLLIRGVGMYANNATGEMRLHNQTSVIITPKK